MIYGKEEDKNKYKIEYLGEKFSKDLKSYKIIFLGKDGSGKESIIHKLMGKEIKTIGIDINFIQVKVNDKIIQIRIWNSYGGDIYAQNTPNFFKNSDIAILVYSINDKKSFEYLNNWYNILKEHSYDSIKFLIGNKSNLEEEREVTIQDVEIFKNNKYDIKIFFETSAKNGENIDKLLDNIAISLYEKVINEKNKFIKGGRISLNKKDFTEKRFKRKSKCG